MVWTIDKQFDFCYGHRVWTQELNPEYSLDACTKCRHMHGHQGKIKIELQASRLEKGMVTDFKHLNWVKQMIDDLLDHKFIMDINDPLWNHVHPYISKKFMYKVPPYKGIKDDNLWIYVLDMAAINKHLDELEGISPEERNALVEFYEGMVYVPFVPTSENLCAWIGKVVQYRMKDIVTVTGVHFWETPKSHCHVELPVH